MRIAVISLAIAFCLSIGIADAQNISDEAMRHFDRGQAAVEMAKSPADYEDAIKEFERAMRLAPDWPDVYYNLGLIQEKVDKYDDAIGNLTKYLELSPNASDSRDVKKFIAKIEYKMEKAKAEYDKIKDLLGTWETFIVGEKYATCILGTVITAKHGVIEVNTWFEDIGSAQFDGQKLKFKYFHDLGAMQKECEHDMKIMTDVLMRGYLNSKLVGVGDTRNADIIGDKQRTLIEMRKR